LTSLRIIQGFQGWTNMSAFKNIAKLIGLSRHGARYKYVSTSLTPVTIYFTTLYLVCSCILSISQHRLIPLLFIGVLMLVINESLFRTSDFQSLIMLNSTIFAFEAMRLTPGPIVFLGFFLAVNPFGYFLGILNFSKQSGAARLIQFKPFDHSQLENDFCSFLSPVPERERIYFAFEDPGSDYSRIFDGYRVIHELSLYAAAKKELHLFPDWWAVSETNFTGAPQIWGRTPDSVYRNCATWGSSYAIVYQKGRDRLDSIWLNKFQVLGEFDWDNYISLFDGFPLPWEKDEVAPKFFLLHKTC